MNGTGTYKYNELVLHTGRITASSFINNSSLLGFLGGLAGLQMNVLLVVWDQTLESCP